MTRVAWKARLRGLLTLTSELNLLLSRSPPECHCRSDNEGASQEPGDEENPGSSTYPYNEMRENIIEDCRKAVEKEGMLSGDHKRACE